MLFRSYGGDRDALIEARDGALGEASKLRGQLRSKDLELSRLKDEAGEAAEERKRLLEVNARKAQQLDALEKTVQQLRQQESESRRSVQDLMGKLAAKETASVTTSLQANTQSQQIALLQRRAADADEHAQAHGKLIDELRKQLAETSAEASAAQAKAGADKVQLTTQLAGARKQVVRLQAEVEAAQEAQRAVLSAKQRELMQAQLKLGETEQLAELYRQGLDEAKQHGEGVTVDSSSSRWREAVSPLTVAAMGTCHAVEIGRAHV